MTGGSVYSLEGEGLRVEETRRAGAARSTEGGPQQAARAG